MDIRHKLREALPSVWVWESLHYGTRNPLFSSGFSVRGGWITSKFRFVTSDGRLTYGKIYFSNWGHRVYWQPYFCSVNGGRISGRHCR